MTEIRHNASAVVQPGEHTVIANLNASDPANITGLAGAAITEIRHDASSVIQPGDYALSAKVNAGTTSISNMSDTIIDHGNSPSTQLGDYTVSAKVKSGNADISNLSGTSINQISHDASVQPGNYSLSVVETQVASNTASNIVLKLDGETYIEVPGSESLNPKNALTIEAWLKPEKMTGEAVAKDWGGQRDYIFPELVGSNNLRFVLWPETKILDSPGVEIGEWQHVAGTWDGQKMRSYINGNEVGSVDYNVEELNDSEVSLYIGAGDSPHWTYTGLIDELRIWETARTQQELKDSMMKSLNGNEAGLNALYSFEGNAKDSTANGNNGEEVIGTPEYVDGELSLVSSTSPSTTRSLRITAPDATTHEVIYDMTDTSVDFPSLGLQVNTSNLSNMTSILLNNPHTFTINPTLEVTPPVGPTVETEYSFNNNSQTIDFSGLDIDVHTNNAQAMTNTLLDNSEDFTINPTLKIVAPDGGTTQEIQYNANNNSQTIDFSGLGIDIHTNNAQAMTNALLNSSGSFTIDTRLKATAPDGTQQEIQYPSSAQSQTVSFNTLGLELDSSNAEQTATQLLNHSQGFTIDTRLKATAPDGTQQEIQYPSSSESQTVSFSDLGLDVDSNNAQTTSNTVTQSLSDFQSQSYYVSDSP
ncbi:TPA: LamG domain-containing protein [Candidatus Poribacteria bacterium]|nr:LamG domain-containing protein [Candidatus Poribacteria bacterium]